MIVPFVDLQRQHRAIWNELETAVRAVVESSQFVLGRFLETFEHHFAEYCGVRHAIGVGSGTDALFLALAAAGIGPGDEVVTVPFTFAATAEAIRRTGATVVFVDVDPHTATIDPGQLERVITSRTKAILPVHLYGHPADMDRILTIAKRHGALVIEDAAQAHGTLYKGRRTGGLGHIGCFSFYPNKNLGALGDGGMVVTNDGAVAAKVRLLRDHGRRSKYEHVMVGYNSRLDGLQAALLDVKLRHLDHWNAQRVEAAERYLVGLPGSSLGLPSSAPWATHVYHLFVVRVPDREAFQRQMEAAGVTTLVHYPLPLHLQPAFASLPYKVGDFPWAERLAREVVSLPMFPGIREEEIAGVVHAVMLAITGSPTCV
ncbi:MAG: DegT/DnrJ/EryC1/StrS family aminotransferase [Elusimicrobia bacterium]|nr:DegT/DnrJ/EryC1/StrS family aminotransferase [Elusimicrobiota bacterium]